MRGWQWGLVSGGGLFGWGREGYAQRGSLHDADVLYQTPDVVVGAVEAVVDAGVGLLDGLGDRGDFATEFGLGGLDGLRDCGDFAT